MAVLGEVREPAASLLLGIVLWARFPLVQRIGAVVPEGSPWRLALIRAGDWLVEFPLVAMVETLLS